MTQLSFLGFFSLLPILTLVQLMKKKSQRWARRGHIKKKKKRPHDILTICIISAVVISGYLVHRGFQSCEPVKDYPVTQLQLEK